MNSKRGLQFFVAPLLLASVVSCSLLLKTEDAQCQIQDDCTGLGPEFSGYTCSPDHVCVKPGEFCDTNAQCVDANGGKPFVCQQDTHRCAEGCADSADGTKTGNAQCVDANGGKPFLCVQGKCAEGCADNASGTKSANAQCSEAFGAKFICKDSKCVEGCVPAPDGSRTATQVCQANSGNDHVCRDGVCVVGCETDAQCDIAKGTKPPFVCSSGQCVEGCRTNVQCINAHNGNWTCRKDKNVCVSLLSPECYQVLADPLQDLKSDDILFIGSYDGLTNNGSLSNLEGGELARREWMKSGGGTLPLGKRNRPIAFLNCDNAHDAAAAQKHMFDEVGIKIVKGPTSPTVIGTFPTVVQQFNLGAFCGNGSAIELDPVFKGSNGTMVRTNLSDSVISKAWPAFMTNFVEPAVHTKYAIPAATPIKVSFAIQSDATGSGLSDFYNTNIMFNGLSVAANGANFLGTKIGDPANDPNITATETAAAGVIAGYAPHIIFYAASLFSIATIKFVEDAWTDVTHRPIWILPSTINNKLLVSSVVNTYPAGAVRDDLRHRMVGVSALSANPVALSAYQLRHKAEFPTATFVWTALPPAPGTSTPPPAAGPNLNSGGNYDAVYLLFTTMIAAGKEDPTGMDLAAALAKTQPAAGITPTDVGPANVQSIIAAAVAGTTVDLNGVLSNLDLHDNSISGAVQFYCVSSAGTAPVAAGYTFDAVAGTYAGTAPTGIVFPVCN